jgi:predicted nuclease of restriction endonuclease-like (RecB) superfamily
MRKVAEQYDNVEFVQQVVAQIPWAHNLVIMEKIKYIQERIWYINKTVENGWSRNILAHQIESKLYEHQCVSVKTTNYTEKLAKPNSDLALETLKDPYIFDFITMREDMNERDIES